MKKLFIQLTLLLIPMLLLVFIFYKSDQRLQENYTSIVNTIETSTFDEIDKSYICDRGTEYLLVYLPKINMSVMSPSYNGQKVRKC